MPKIVKHLIDHEKISLDKHIRDLAKEEAEKLPRDGGSGGGGGGGMEDAPTDGTTYGRLNASWAPVSTTETDPLSLHLDQTTLQNVINGAPQFDEGITIAAGKKLYLDGI